MGRRRSVIIFCFFTAFFVDATARGSDYYQAVSLAETFGQNPFALDGAFLREETFGPNVRYWQPTLPNAVGAVTYKFEVPFTIKAAELYLGITAYTVGSDANFDPGAEIYLDVSIDNATWTTIASQTPSNAQFSGISGPWAIGTNVGGFSTVYVRSRLLMTTDYSGFGTSQFLREGFPYTGGYFTASSVPEPSTFTMCVTALFAISLRYRQIRKR